MKWGLLSFISLLILTLSANGGMLKQGQWVTVNDTTIIHNDLYFTGQNVNIEGIVEGDFLAGGKRISITGIVKQNLYAVAQTIRITGEVGGDIWGFAQDIEIEGKGGSGFRGGCSTLLLNSEINGDVIVGAGQVMLGPRAIINGDLFAYAQDVNIEGKVYGRVKGNMGTLRIAGLVTKNVDVEVDKIKLDPSGKIEGDLKYKSHHPLSEDVKDRVSGQTIFSEVKEKKTFVFCNWLWRLWSYLAAIITGLILVLFFKEKIRDNLDRFLNHPWKILLVGFLSLIAIPVAAIIALITLIGIPLGLILVGLYAIFLYLSWVIAGILLGRLILQILGTMEPSLILSALIGLFILILVGWIPYLGGFVNLVVILFGLGIILQGLYRLFWRTV